MHVSTRTFWINCTLSIQDRVVTLHTGSFWAGFALGVFLKYKSMFYLALAFLFGAGSLWAASSDTSSVEPRKRVATVAVLPFADANPGAQEEGLGRVVAAMLGTHLRNETSFIVLERSNLLKVLDEKQYEDAGLTKETRDKLRQMLSVEVLLTGEVARLSSQIQIDLRLISVSTGEVVVAEYATVKNPEDLRASISKLAKTIEDRYLRQWMGNLSVLVHPVEGEIYLDDQFMGKASMNAPLKLQGILEGQYRLKVLAGGYQVFEQLVEVQPRTVRELQVALKSLPGSLQVSSEPLGASVWLNGRESGVTPVNLDTLPEGNYNIRLAMKNFKEWSQRVSISSGQVSDVKAKLEVVQGQILVESQPTGAKVFVGPSLMGQTPMLLDNVNPGTVGIAMRLDGYANFSTDVVVQPGERAKISAVLKRQTGKLTVVSSDADVHADILDAAGNLVGGLELPIHKQPLDAGEYQVVITRAKCFEDRHKIVIAPDEETRITADMRQKPGRISIAHSAQTPVDIFVDGRYLGKASGLAVELPEGDHELFLRNYHGEKRMKLHVVADETLEIPASSLEVQKGLSLWSALGALLFTGAILLTAEVKK